MAEACRMCGSPETVPAGAVKGYAFVECVLCNFVFAPAITADGMAALYTDGWHGVEDGGPEIGWANLEFLEPAFRLLPPRRLEILDFGTGQSFVPDLLRDQGHRVVAVDIVPPLRRHPDRLTGPLDALGLAEGHFDLVFAFQVFEHLPEPRPTLASLLRLARPGGLVLVHTDMETPERGERLADWWYALPPDHCSFYRHRSFEVALAGMPHRLAWRDAKTVIIRAWAGPGGPDGTGRGLQGSSRQAAREGVPNERPMHIRLRARPADARSHPGFRLR